MRARAEAARLPAVVFAGIFLAVVYIAGRVMSGPTAGAAALIIAAFVQPCVEYGRQARYYSAALAFGTLCFLALWQVARRGYWRDYLLLSVSLIVLFFSYSVAFGVTAAVWLIASPWSLRKPGALVKSLAAIAIVSIPVIAWLTWTGAAGNHTGIPPARILLAFPRDYVAYLSAHRALAGGLGIAVLSIALLSLLKAIAPHRIASAWSRQLPVIAYGLLWIVTGFAVFVLTIPASSLFMGRVKLGTLGPGIVLAGVVIQAGASLLSSRWQKAVPIAVLLAVAGVSAKPVLKMIRPLGWREPGFAFVEDCRGWVLEPGTRIYAVPIENLCLTFAAGLPVQSVAPVRRAFFDTYPGRILIIDSAPGTSPIAGEDGLWQNPAMFRGYESYNLADFWVNFFYRFVDPNSRRGAGANYAGRVIGVRPQTLPCGWVLYDCPAKGPQGSSPKSAGLSGRTL